MNNEKKTQEVKSALWGVVLGAKPVARQSADGETRLNLCPSLNFLLSGLGRKVGSWNTVRMVFHIPFRSKQGSQNWETMWGHNLVQRLKVQRTEQVQLESRAKAMNAQTVKPWASVPSWKPWFLIQMNWSLNHCLALWLSQESIRKE